MPWPSGHHLYLHPNPQNLAPLLEQYWEWPCQLVTKLFTELRQYIDGAKTMHWLRNWQIFVFTPAKVCTLAFRPGTPSYGKQSSYNDGTLLSQLPPSTGMGALLHQCLQPFLWPHYRGTCFCIVWQQRYSCQNFSGENTNKNITRRQLQNVCLPIISR